MQRVTSDRKNGVQALSFQQLAHHEASAVSFANIVNAKDIGMIEGCHSTGFLLKAPQTIAISRKRGRQDLYRNLTT